MNYKSLGGCPHWLRREGARLETKVPDCRRHLEIDLLTILLQVQMNMNSKAVPLYGFRKKLYSMVEHMEKMCESIDFLGQEL